MKRALVLALLLVGTASAADEPYRAALLMEAGSGTVLHELDGDVPRPTASMVKMMTALVVADAITAGELAWDTPVEVSARASGMGGSQVYLRRGEVFTVEALLAATLIHSGNDAAYALAEAVGGSVEPFVERMNAKGRELGLVASRFHTPHGLPPAPRQAGYDEMSPRDLATVGRAVLANPKLREVVGTLEAPFRNGFRLVNRNHLVGKYPGASGIKTGYHRAAEFCITASAERNGMELIAVIMGVGARREMFRHAEVLLDWGFDNWEMREVLRQGDSLAKAAAVRDGALPVVPVAAGASVQVVSRRDGPDPVDVVVVSSLPAAPVMPGDEVGIAIVRVGGSIVARIPAVALEPVRPPSWWERVLAFL